LHESESCGSHATHAAPPVPHVFAVRVRHCGPEQHPFGQLVAVQLLQMPAVHVAGLGQLWHVRPAVPHAIAVLPARHCVPCMLQQPAQLLC
jgi:hypothetical protein